MCLCTGRASFCTYPFNNIYTLIIYTTFLRLTNIIIHVLPLMMGKQNCFFTVKKITMSDRAGVNMRVQNELSRKC